MPAVIEIAILLEVTEKGTTESIYQPVGSGTIISTDGLILTNHHVIDVAAHRAQLEAREAQASRDGELLTFALDEDRVLILGTDGASVPKPGYIAEVAADDQTLDLAVLRITGNASGASLSTAGTLPFIHLGDSSSVLQGDPIDLFGYPVIGGDKLTYTNGVVSGFNFEERVDGPAPSACTSAGPPRANQGRRSSEDRRGSSRSSQRVPCSARSSPGSAQASVAASRSTGQE